jgi:hypothetical protein
LQLSKISYLSITISSFLFLLTGCSIIKSSKQEAAFKELFPNIEMNSKIRFWDPKTANELFKIGDSVDLTLENLTTDKIIFPSDYGIKIFTLNNSVNWTEISNRAHYFPPGNPQVSPKGEGMPGIIGIGCYPELTNEGKPIVIRVAVVGTVYHDNVPTNERVGAFVDVTLQP